MKKLSIVAAALITAGVFEFAVANTKTIDLNTHAKFYTNVTDTVPGKKTPSPTPSPSPLPSPNPVPSPNPSPSPNPNPSPNPAPSPSPTPTPTPAPPHQ